MKARPFLKWVGGKTQILSDIRKKYPLKSPKKYCEPFLGGGAVFFDVINCFSVDEILLNDLNKDLIEVYTSVKNEVSELINKLKRIEREFLPLTTEDRRKYYLEKRAFFNLEAGDTLTRSSLFIFLNKTCFNGLYRVNSNGKFNVPSGNYKKPLICDEENLLLTSDALQNVMLRADSYENCLDFIDDDTFVYFDPPYRPIGKTSNFNSYTKFGFDDGEQQKLKEFIDIISKKGCHLILSNSDPKSVSNDDFFDKMYRDYHLTRISANRAINCKGEQRGKVSEILVSNF